MRSRRAFYFSLALLTAVFIINSTAVWAGSFGGYTLFAPNNSKSTRLLDSSKTLVHSWTHSRTGGYSVYLLENTNILRTASSTTQYLGGGGATGVTQEVDWAGNVVWEYTYSTTTVQSHHDIEPMPNGNVLIIAWEVKSAAQAVQAGLSRSVVMWPDHIIEVQPSGTSGGTIVWQWHAWDHLIQDYNSAKDNYGVVGDHPELLDINAGSSEIPPGGGDWMHINAISYDSIHDQIVISSHNLDEIYVIDHSTTTAEAAGHTGGNGGKGGDFLYRWGNPANYDQSGTHYFYVCHNSNWIPEGYPGAGNILVFNNREGYGTSIVTEITPPRDALGNYTYTPGTAYSPTSPTWTYTAAGFYTNHLGSCQRLRNGNTFIVESTSGILFEVDSLGNTVWTYTYGGEVSRALRYATSYSGLDSLTGGTNDAPVVSDIPDQTIAEGGSFATISLDNYVTDPDNADAEMTWTYAGNSSLTVSITNRVATITTPSSGWNGAETITFRATDPGGLYDEDAATFTVTGDNDAPVVSDIPDQTITAGGSFATVNLDDYVADPDNTDAEMNWVYGGALSLAVDITDRVVTITPPSSEWTGSETITFRAIDPGSLYGEDVATFTVNAAGSYVCGDANGDTKINVGDAVYVITYVFRGGPAPDPLAAGDANGDTKINVGDAVYIITYVFRGGPAPICP